MDERKRQLIKGIEGALNATVSQADSIALLHPDVVLDWSRSLAPYRSVVHGRVAAEAYLADFHETWAALNFKYEVAAELRDGTVVLATSVSAMGAGSGVQAPTARGSQMVSFREGLISELRLFQDPADAIAFATLRERQARLARAHLYFVCEALPNGRDPTELLRAAIAGGAEVIQMREKTPRSAEETVALAQPFARVARETGALFFLNDQPDLAERSGADGVHVGQDDLPVAQARALAGGAALVGLSTHSPEQFDAALAAEGDSAPDQLSTGPVWETPTKQGRPASGLGLIEHAAGTATARPWFAIGGIDSSNISEVVEAGATRAVVVRAIRDAADPAAAASVLREALPSRQT